ncbi:hypothetical protein ACWOC1_11810 [Enterococcus quebecensis]|uniref:Uncharacterized protein n=1 Tax=Enterococcus quebecensis TaxID=903983 RepID=A0A1E5GTM0_9ENTE|nr:hypothetical protein [Enterococcus quebecensis]OEG16044.1 hypothetical protein BCR23_07815 [Enterococcus quebecensis]OJG75023.1 hypothetical protein RV12_GL002068 [Enterococcus quebecensis]
MKIFKSKQFLVGIVGVLLCGMLFYKYLRLFHGEIFPVDNKFIVENQTNYEIEKLKIYQSLRVSESNLKISLDDTLLASYPDLKNGDKKVLYYEKEIPSDGNLVLIYETKDGKKKYQFGSEYLPYGTRWSETKFNITNDDSFFE